MEMVIHLQLTNIRPSLQKFWKMHGPYSTFSLEARLLGQNDTNLRRFGVTTDTIVMTEDQFHMLKEIL